MVYAPGTLETDPKKQNMALQQQAKAISSNTGDIATNTAAIATNTTDIATKITGPAASTDNAAVRFDSTTGKLAQNSALLIADTTGSLSRSGNGGIPLQGTNTNDDAAAGYVGEYLESNVTVAVNVLTNSPTTITSITLTPGDWDVCGDITVFPNGSNTLTEIHACLSDTTNALTGLPYGAPHAAHVNFIDGQAAIWPTGVARWCFASNKTVYLVVNLKYTTGSTMTVSGCIRARRMR